MVVVGCIEGCVLQTVTLLRHVLAERVIPYLFLAVGSHVFQLVIESDPSRVVKVCLSLSLLKTPLLLNKETHTFEERKYPLLKGRRQKHPPNPPSPHTHTQGKKPKNTTHPSSFDPSSKLLIFF